MAELLKKLSETNGVSGNEDAVRKIIVGEVKKLADNVTIDSMGNVIAFKKGAKSGKTLAVAANMDEPGFIVSEITDKGYLKVKSVGSIDPRKIISKKVVIGEKSVKGIIGMKAIHLQTRSERENTVSVSKLFVDIGAKNKQDAEKYVSLGDYVTFDTVFSHIGNNVKGKALDRSGVSRALIKALEKDYPYDFYACFLTQHEVGARGAKIAAHRLKADAILVLTAEDTEDMYGCEKEKSGVQLGKGVAVKYADKGIIADKQLTDCMLTEAECVQISALKEFSSSAGAMQTAAGGSRCLCASIPCRYSRSPVSLISLDDISSAAEYVSLFLNRIGDMI